MTGAPLTACTDRAAPPEASATGRDAVGIAPAPPAAGDPAVRRLRFLSDQEAETLDVLVGRILPGDADDPGAREAGVVFYIDEVLSHRDGFAGPVYLQPPFAVPYDGEEPSQTERPGVVHVERDELPRYGYQSPLTPVEIYRQGLAELDEYCRSEYGAPMYELDPEVQDEVVQALVDGEVTSTDVGPAVDNKCNGDQCKGFADPSTANFFGTVRNHVVEGMFSDPLYGGNREMVGWQLIGYPGAQRGYTPADLLDVETPIPAQSLTDLHPFRAGRSDIGDPRLPVSGQGEAQRAPHDDRVHHHEGS